ncbi:MAG: FtsX-like permease family protein, partial [Tannerellaceae bacterium]|nr:FtsX-like permease family protein [Tannerellaceae bacterium]
DFLEVMSKALRIGNFHLQSLIPCAKIGADTTRMFGQSGDLNVRLALFIFFLLNILLCAMGTFWYRVNQRRGEVGLRKALGATRAGISAAFFLEGLCLLALSAAVAMAIEFQFVYAGLIDTLGKYDDSIYLPDRMLLRFLITNGLTACTLAAVILIAVWLPARRAATHPPAESLRDE